VRGFSGININFVSNRGSLSHPRKCHLWRHEQETMMTTQKELRDTFQRQQMGDEFHHQDIFWGTGAVYIVSEHYPGPDVFTGDYFIDFQHDTHPEQLRAMRSEQVREGKMVRRLPPEALRHQTLVVFGAEVKPDQAIRDLERTIEVIKEAGLFAGHDSRGDIVWEPSSSGR
jgi:hypothetical protein